MNKELIKTLTPALRQYRKQTEDKFVGAYDYDVSNQIVSELESELQSLRAENEELRTLLSYSVSSLSFYGNVKHWNDMKAKLLSRDSNNE